MTQNNECKLKSAPMSMLSPEDVFDMGYDPSTLSQEEFNEFALEVGANIDLMGSWWLALKEAADKRELEYIGE